MFLKNSAQNYPQGDIVAAFTPLGLNFYKHGGGYAKQRTNSGGGAHKGTDEGKQSQSGGACRKTGIKQNTISAWLLEKKEPSIRSLWLLADYFNVDIDYLVGRKDY